MNSNEPTPSGRSGDAHGPFPSADRGVEFRITATGSGVVVGRSAGDKPVACMAALALFGDSQTFLGCCRLDPALVADPRLQASLSNAFNAAHAKVTVAPRAQRASLLHDPATNTAVDLIRHVRDATRPEQVLETMHLATRALGADSSFYVGVSAGEASERFVRLLLDCDPTWWYAYGPGCCWAIDPWIGQLRLKSAPVLTGELQGLDDRLRRVVELRRDRGFASALLIPARNGERPLDFGGLCLGSAVPGKFEDEAAGIAKMLAQSLALEIHEWFRANKNLDHAAP